MPAKYFNVIDPQRLVYRDVMRTKKGSNIVYVQTAEGKARLQLCKHTDNEKQLLPFGVTSFDNPDSGRKSLEISLGSNEELIRYFQALDERNIQMAIQNKKTWFSTLQKIPSDDKIRDMYYPLVSVDTSGKNYPPRLHTKINCHSGDSKLRVFKLASDGQSFQKMEIDDIKKQMSSMPIVEIHSIWFQKLQFGMTLLTTDLVIFSTDSRKEGIEEFEWGSCNAPKEVAQISESDLPGKNSPKRSLPSGNAIQDLKDLFQDSKKPKL